MRESARWIVARADLRARAAPARCSLTFDEEKLLIVVTNDRLNFFWLARKKVGQPRVEEFKVFFIGTVHIAVQMNKGKLMVPVSFERLLEVSFHQLYICQIETVDLKWRLTAG